MVVAQRLGEQSIRPTFQDAVAKLLGQSALAFNPADRSQQPVAVERVRDIGIDEHAAGPTPGVVQPDARASLDADGQLQRAVRMRVGDQDVREDEELGRP
jgi:hypothetical protein